MSTRIPSSVRLAVRERDLGSCVACGAGAHEVMHRIRRREGSHRLSNLASGCSVCHRRCHANPSWAMERGYILSAVADVDPSTEPMLTWRGWVLLDDDGGLSVVAPRASEKPPSRGAQESEVPQEV